LTYVSYDIKPLFTFIRRS